jgi:hypothetical protein
MPEVQVCHDCRSDEALSAVFSLSHAWALLTIFGLGAVWSYARRYW